MKKSILSQTSTQSQVFELLGRAVYLCKVIELRLRWMHKHCGGIWTGKTPQELLESLKKAIDDYSGVKKTSFRNGGNRQTGTLETALAA